MDVLIFVVIEEFEIQFFVVDDSGSFSSDDEVESKKVEEFILVLELFDLVVFVVLVVVVGRWNMLFDRIYFFMKKYVDIVVNYLVVNMLCQRVVQVYQIVVNNFYVQKGMGVIKVSGVKMMEGGKMV